MDTDEWGIGQDPVNSLLNGPRSWLPVTESIVGNEHETESEEETQTDKQNKNIIKRATCLLAVPRLGLLGVTKFGIRDSHIFEALRSGSLDFRSLFIIGQERIPL
jgi:hypothetical protein